MFRFMTGLVLALATLGTGAAKATDFTLTITGNASARYWLSCAGAVPLELKGQPPITRSFGGPRLDCRIRQTAAGGTLAIEARSSSGNVSRLTTSGRDSTVRLVLE